MRNVGARIQAFDFILETKPTPFVHPKDEKKGEAVAIEIKLKGVALNLMGTHRLRPRTRGAGAREWM
jgi:hypothetical protein